VELILSAEPMILIDEAGMAAIHQPSENAKRVNGSYYALVEVYHELHCLNLVRKYIWRDDYSEDISFQGPESQVLEHVGQLTP
jgi:hypothetical protein